MAINHQAFSRLLTTLRFIPRFPEKVTAMTLKEKLESNDFMVSKRTIERDLNDLSRFFPLVIDDRNKPYGWSWSKDAAMFNLPGLGQNEALMLLMVEQNLKQLMPSSSMEIMAPYFKAAKNELSSIKNQSVRHWLNKVQSINPGPSFIAPEIKPEIQAIVTNALFTNYQLRVKYKNRTNKVNEFVVHPLAMFQRGVVIYLYIRLDESDDFRTLALHRIQGAEKVNKKTEYPKNFDINKISEEGLFTYDKGEQTKIELLFKEGYGLNLIETPLSLDQTFEIDKNKRLKIMATITLSQQFESWILSMGNTVKILSPKLFKEKMISHYKDILKDYT